MLSAHEANASAHRAWAGTGAQARAGWGNHFLPGQLQSGRLRLLWRVQYVVADGGFSARRPQWHLKADLDLRKGEAVVLLGEKAL